MGKKTELVSEYLISSVPTAKPTDTAGDVLRTLPGRSFESVDSVYLIDDDGMLLGVARLVDLYAAAPDTRLSALMGPASPSVHRGVDREDAASLAIKAEVSVMPVTQEDGRFLGVFPARAIMHVLREEHLEDLHQMAGISLRSEDARRALEAAPLQRARYRLPWLMVGLAGSMLATGLVAHFDQILRAEIAVAFFIPAIVYLADAVGTQSEAVAVRGLSLTSLGIGRLLIDELLTGVFVGLVMAFLSGVFVVVAFDRFDLAAAVSLTLLGASAVATTLGLVLPWTFARAGWDPALAAGPVGTIVQDVLSLLIYFGTVSMFVLPHA